MDHKLVAWARAVKARRRGRGPPPLWLFSDSRVPDLPAAIAALPRGLCGVVYRGPPDGARAVQRQCRALGIPVTVAGVSHLRGGRGGRPRGVSTSSAHGRVQLLRACRAGVRVVFLSPVFPTASHPGAAALGVLRWAAMARSFPASTYALGGMTGVTVRRLPGWVAGVGAVGALLPSSHRACATARMCHMRHSVS